MIRLLLLALLTMASNSNCSPPEQTAAGRRRAKKQARKPKKKKNPRAPVRNPDNGTHPPRVPRGSRVTTHQQTHFTCPVCGVRSEGGRRHNKVTHRKKGSPV